ncbi:hypothetical protein Nepgr_017404 [Nepenthes gracilis]|uniref:Uncharacterized protein n=1 Tax=Nepenthes gracilis TaxID=150966 RepID=A0AAD3SQC0_NEPGR|nr:hypothetical protein Nepgr_017404 [Nepenthes gracilis]
MVASVPCVGAECSEFPEFQVGPPLTLAGSPPGRPYHSPDHTLGSGTDAPLLHPLAEIEHCPSKTLSLLAVYAEDGTCELLVLPPRFCFCFLDPGLNADDAVDDCAGCPLLSSAGGSLGYLILMRP